MRRRIYSLIFGILITAVVMNPAAQGQTFHKLHSFTGADGAVPWTSGVVRDAAGNLYGTTRGGGAHGLGTVFKVDTSNHETVLHSFSGPDGSSPTYGVIVDASGDLYGVTELGGANGFGTVFKVDTARKATVLYSFSGPDGAYPSGGLISDRSGNLYGITAGGGAHNFGTVFELDTVGNETVLYSFTGASDGTTPSGGLLLDSAGNLYGTTENDGTDSLGTVFRLDPSGEQTVLHAFTGADGQAPEGGLIRDSAGNLYGTTAFGGLYGSGTIFRLDTNNMLHSVPVTGGNYPWGGVVADSSGNLYGTTALGGSGKCYETFYRGGQKYVVRVGCGVIFKVSTTDKLTVLYNFPGGSAGPGAAVPMGRLLRSTSGNLYGTTLYGGEYGLGTVFKWVP